MRVAWVSSVDDVTIDVRFERLDGGRTRVRLDGTATGPGAGAGFSFVRMTPQWLPRHLARRAGGHVRPPLGPLHVVLLDATPAASARWLVDAFGFEPTGDIPEEEPAPDHTWVELRAGDGSAAVILWGLDGTDGSDPPGEGVSAAPASGAGAIPWVFVDDLDTIWRGPRRPAPPSSRPSSTTGSVRTRRPTPPAVTGSSPRRLRLARTEPEIGCRSPD